MTTPSRSANERLKDAYGRILAAALGRSALMHLVVFQAAVIPVPVLFVEPAPSLRVVSLATPRTSDWMCPGPFFSPDVFVSPPALRIEPLTLPPDSVVAPTEPVGFVPVDTTHLPSPPPAFPAPSLEPRSPGGDR